MNTPYVFLFWLLLVPVAFFALRIVAGRAANSMAFAFTLLSVFSTGRTLALWAFAFSAARLTGITALALCTTHAFLLFNDGKTVAFMFYYPKDFCICKSRF